MPKSRYKSKARRARRGRQFLTLLFHRTWTGKHFRSEYEADDEMWKFGASKGAARYWILRLRRLGLAEGWSAKDWRLNRRGSWEFVKDLVKEAAEIVTDPEKNAAPPSKEFRRRVSLIMDVGRQGGASLTPKLSDNDRDRWMGFAKDYRKEFGDKEADVLLRIGDMAFGQIERDQSMKRIMMFPLLPI